MEDSESKSSEDISEDIRRKDELEAAKTANAELAEKVAKLEAQMAKEEAAKDGAEGEAEPPRDRESGATDASDFELLGSADSTAYADAADADRRPTHHAAGEDAHADRRPTNHHESDEALRAKQQLEERIARG